MDHGRICPKNRGLLARSPPIVVIDCKPVAFIKGAKWYDIPPSRIKCVDVKSIANMKFGSFVKPLRISMSDKIQFPLMFKLERVVK